MSHDKTAVQKAIYGRMAGDSTLTSQLGARPAAYGTGQSIWYQQAPEEAGYPFVIFERQSATPIDALKKGAAVVENEVWLIKAVDHNNNSALPVNAVAQRIDELFNDISGGGVPPLSISGRAVMSMRRLLDIDFAEVQSGETYRHAGATYRLFHQST